MSGFIVPFKKPTPNIAGFLDVMNGNKLPDKPPIVEFLIDDTLMKPILEEMIGRKWVDVSFDKCHIGSKMNFSKENTSVINSWLDNQISFWYHMGYDFIRLEIGLNFPVITYSTTDTAEGNRNNNRVWQSLTEGVIKDWDDYNNYPWPKITDNNFYVHNYICEHLPDGMGFITCHSGGVFEHTSRLLGYENLCLNLTQDPLLVVAVINKVGELIYQYYKILLKFEGISAILQGDDLGFNTQTLISPKDLKEYFLPWHKKIADLCHKNNRP